MLPWLSRLVADKFNVPKYFQTHQSGMPSPLSVHARPVLRPDKQHACPIQHRHREGHHRRIRRPHFLLDVPARRQKIGFAGDAIDLVGGVVQVEPSCAVADSHDFKKQPIGINREGAAEHGQRTITTIARAIPARRRNIHAHCPRHRPHLLVGHRCLNLRDQIYHRVRLRFQSSRTRAAGSQPPACGVFKVA